MFKSQLYLVGGLYHSSILKSFALSYQVLTLGMSAGPSTRPSYTRQENLFLQLSFLQYFLHNFQFSGTSLLWMEKKCFSQNFSLCSIREFHMTGSIFEVRCQIIKENKIVVISYIYSRTQGFLWLKISVFSIQGFQALCHFQHHSSAAP